MRELSTARLIAEPALACVKTQRHEHIEARLPYLLLQGEVY